MNNESLNTRNSNLEFLRIIAMIFIISHHLFFYGFGSVNFVIYNPNNILLYFLGVLGKIGVILFILISSYFMVNSKFTFRKLLILGGEVYFYSIIFLVMFLMLSSEKLSIIEVLQSMLPISHNGYWFITDYIVLMLISPFLNIFINNLDKHNFLKLLLLVIFMWVMYPTFTGYSFAYSDMIFFIVLYLIGSFIRLHLDINKINIKKLILIFSVSLTTTYLLFYFFDSIPLLNQLVFFNRETSIFMQTNCLFIVITAISLFLILLKRKEFSNKYINYISGSVLGVYLIHENIFVRPFIWKYFLHIQSYYYSPNLFIFAIMSIIFIYLVCTGIDIIRRLTIEKLWIYFVDKKLNIIPQWLKVQFEIFERKINQYLN